MIALTDQVDTIRAIMESCDFVADIVAKISSIFTDKEEGGIVMMTIDKSKGLENPRVFILSPELLPHPRAKRPEDITVEMNLKYVAMTRVKFTVESKGSLFWVQSSDAVRAAATVTFEIGNKVTYKGEDFVIEDVAQHGSFYLQNDNGLILAHGKEITIKD